MKPFGYANVFGNIFLRDIRGARRKIRAPD